MKHEDVLEAERRLFEAARRYAASCLTDEPTARPNYSAGESSLMVRALNFAETFRKWQVGSDEQGGG